MSIEVEKLAKSFLESELPEGGECCKISFLAGYQAAKDQVADADKVMPQWINVGWRNYSEATHWLEPPAPPKEEK